MCKVSLFLIQLVHSNYGLETVVVSVCVMCCVCALQCNTLVKEYLPAIVQIIDEIIGKDVDPKKLCMVRTLSDLLLETALHSSWSCLASPNLAFTCVSQGLVDVPVPAW